MTAAVLFVMMKREAEKTLLAQRSKTACEVQQQQHSATQQHCNTVPQQHNDSAASQRSKEQQSNAAPHHNTAPRNTATSQHKNYHDFGGFWPIFVSLYNQYMFFHPLNMYRLII